MAKIPRLYVVIPILVLGVILANAFFGHLLFGSVYDKLINKYSIYVHLQQPGWESYPGNILYDVTNVWSDSSRASEYLQETRGSAYEINPDEPLALATTYNTNHVKYQDSRPFVELRHEFSDCEIAWQPIPYRYAIDSARGWIESLQGVRVLDAPFIADGYSDAARSDPYVWIFSDTPNLTHDNETQHALAGDGYVQFVPACVSADSVAYDYAVSVNDPKIGFDVYFAMPVGDNNDDDDNDNDNDSKKSIHGFLPYDGHGCGAQNRNSFSGTCDGVGPGSGLLIILPDTLDQSLTRVSIGMHERP